MDLLRHKVLTAWISTWVLRCKILTAWTRTWICRDIRFRERGSGLGFETSDSESVDQDVGLRPKILTAWIRT